MSARGEATRSRLVDATIALVREHGYARTSIRTIAAAAGVAEGTIYRHFPDKAALFVAAVTSQHRPITDWMSRLPELAGTGTVADNLTECLTRLAALRESLVPLELALLTDPELAGARPVPPGPPGPPEMLAAYLRAEQSLGRLRAGPDPGEVAVLLLTVLFGLTMAPPVPPPPGISRPDLRTAVDLILHGVAG